MTVALTDVLPHQLAQHARICVAGQGGIGVQLVGVWGTEQSMQGQAGRLAGDVPQRDIEPAQCEQCDAVAPEIVELALQSFHHPGDVGGILADRERGDQRLQRGAGCRHRIEAERLAVAGDAFVGRDAHDEQVDAAPVRGCRSRPASPDSAPASARESPRLR